MIDKTDQLNDNIVKHIKYGGWLDWIRRKNLFIKNGGFG